MICDIESDSLFDCYIQLNSLWLQVWLINSLQLNDLIKMLDLNFFSESQLLHVCNGNSASSQFLIIVDTNSIISKRHCGTCLEEWRKPKSVVTDAEILRFWTNLVHDGIIKLGLLPLEWNTTVTSVGLKVWLKLQCCCYCCYDCYDTSNILDSLKAETILVNLVEVNYVTKK